MKNKVVISIVAVLVVLATGILTWFFLGRQSAPEAPAEVEVTQESSSTTEESSTEESTTEESTTESSSDVSTGVEVEVEELNESEAYLQSFIYHGDLITDEEARNDAINSIKGILGNLDGKDFAYFNNSYDANSMGLQGTESSMAMTLFIFLKHQGYALDESYVKVWSANPSHIQQVIFRAKQDGREDVYFLGYLDKGASQLTINMRHGGVADATFG